MVPASRWPVGNRAQRAGRHAEGAGDGQRVRGDRRAGERLADRRQQAGDSWSQHVQHGRLILLARRAGRILPASRRGDCGRGLVIGWPGGKGCSCSTGQPRWPCGSRTDLTADGSNSRRRRRWPIGQAAREPRAERPRPARPTACVTLCWSATREQARRRWSRRCSCTPGRSSGAGRVEDGTTVSDFDEVEVRQQRSVNLTLAPVLHGSVKVNLLDTPGYADFTGDLRAGLRAADAALFTVSAADSIDGLTRMLWEECAARRHPPRRRDHQDRPSAGRLRRGAGRLPGRVRRLGRAALPAGDRRAGQPSAA